MSDIAGLILENANILTCDDRQPRAQALSAFEGRIGQVGLNRDIQSLKTKNTRIIDCQGKTLVPGFNDAHCHFFSALRQLFSLDLNPVAVHSIADIQSAIRRKIQYVPSGTWISGADYNEFYLEEKRHPNRADLDIAAPDHPVILTHRSMHACVLNSLAMQIVGINNESEEPPGGIIDRDLKSGEPNGILFEMLPWVQKRIQSPLSSQEYYWGIAELNKRNLEVGITSFCDATLTNNVAQFETFSELIDKGLIQSRVNLMLGADQLPQALTSPDLATSNPTSLNTGILKIVISQATGQMQPDQNELNHLVLESNRNDFQVAIHAVEKNSVEAAVTALEQAQRHLALKDWRNRIEHCSECPPELVTRIARLKAVVVTQPAFLFYQGDRYLHQVPSETQPFLYPFKSLSDAGVVLAGSSDSPVVSNNPLMGIYSAAARRAESGQILASEQRLTAQRALEMYTLGSAYAGFEENEKGSLAVGKLADIVMLSDNPLTCPLEAIKNIRVEMTILGGKVVWER
jgi:predicted amidohydrolase YtcJ